MRKKENIRRVIHAIVVAFYNAFSLVVHVLVGELFGEGFGFAAMLIYISAGFYLLRGAWENVVLGSTLTKYIEDYKENQRTYCGEKQCVYCGADLKGAGGCAEYYGLHTPYIENFYEMRVCPKCDLTVTQTNRILKRVIDSNGEEPAIHSLQIHMQLNYDYWKESDKL